jgi:ATP-dependent DNA helicase RecG
MTEKILQPNTAIEELPLVGPALTKAFHNMKIKTVSDLLFYFPVRYMDFRKRVNIASAEEGDVVTIIGRIISVRSNFGFRGRMSYAEATIEDGTGKIKAIWFNQSYIAKQLAEGDELILSGKVSRYKQLQLSNPAYEKLNEENSPPDFKKNY